VPRNYTKDKSLANWVSNQRKQIKANTMTVARKAKLDSIGFVWDPIDQQWNEMYEKLEAYKRVHGDCLVPQRYAKDESLGLWVKTQRRYHQANTLTAERKAKLDSIGFVWEVIPDWNEMYEKLKTYKHQHGDCLVPAIYDKDKSLGLWVMTQRRYHQANTLTAERKAKLDSIGFAWVVRPDWNEMFEKLKVYKREHGDYLVPCNYINDKSLGNWVSNQRQSNKNDSLSADRKAKLESIGFIWDVREYRRKQQESSK